MLTFTKSITIVLNLSDMSLISLMKITMRLIIPRKEASVTLLKSKIVPKNVQCIMEKKSILFLLLHNVE